MDKNYKKFYEVGNNRYYTIVADGETYLATETFIEVARKIKFLKNKDLIQGLKLLKFTTPIAILFNEIDNSKKLKNQKGIHKDMLKYEHIDNKHLKELIYNAYDGAIEIQRNQLKEWYETMEREVTKKLKEHKNYSMAEFEKSMQVFKNRLEQSLKMLDERHPLKTDIDINDPKHTSGNIIKSMLNSGLEHLYTEKLTGFANNVYLYEQDCFNTVTIYRIITVKSVVKTIDTFIYDKKLIGTLLKSQYEKDIKNNK